MRRSSVVFLVVGLGLAFTSACGSVEGTLTGAGGSTGGVGGATGGVGGAAGGSAGSHAECAQASDCVLHDDCCACASVPKSQSIATCTIECLVDQCSSLGVSAADVACVAGRCVFARSCNTRNIACTIASTACPAGSLPIVKNNCFAGGCLPAAQCSDVASCDVCTSAGLTCVTDEVLGGPVYHCVTVPAACAATPTCACLGTCSGAYQCSDPASTTPSCQCPTC